jgi:cytochrome P450
MGNNLTPLLANFLPQLFARKAWQGREKLVAAFVKYYSLDGHLEASDLTQARYQALQSAGLSLTDIARHEASMGLALLANTVPATFWILYDLYSRPELLSEIRRELKRNVIHGSLEGKLVISVSALSNACPLFVSTYQEILRFRSTSSPVRFAREDVVLNDKYFLKKGSMICIPGRPMSKNSMVWGTSAERFDPRRFIKSSEHNPRQTGGFMAFGVSPVICPGRNFASSEILAMVALVIMRVDLIPEGGVWREPNLNPMAISSIMGPVKGEFSVRVRLREEFKEMTWDCEVEEGAGVFNLMVG